jgi:solute carrier family 20 (sodium-dependent phosphate transporter)
MADLSEYLWIVVVGFIFAFAYAFGIGANDVANAFATVVASKSLTLKQAVLVASIFEFAGAILLGAHVTNTVRSKIFDVDLYDGEPEILLLGMFCALVTGTIMLLGATYYALPVSTTHTIIGSIMGFSIVAKGFDSINWDVVTKIFISWVASPACTGVLAFCCFFTLKKLVLEHANSFERAYYTFPIVLIITIGINAFYVVFKGMNNVEAVKDLEWYAALGIGLAIGCVVALIWVYPWGPWARQRIEKYMAAREAAEALEATEQPRLAANGKDDDGGYQESEGGGAYSEGDEVDCDNPTTWEKENKPKSSVVASTVKNSTIKASAVAVPVAAPMVPETNESSDPEKAERNFFQRFGDATFNQDLQQESFAENARAKEIWEAVEHFDPKAEQLFTYVQVFTSCMDSFAHGANDVANAIAPVSALLLLYQTGDIESKAPVPTWVLAYGGVAMVVGLLLYGYKVIKSIGYKMTPISPSRGSMAELSSALFVVTASFLGIPVSTTQSQVGAVAGIGLVGGWRNVQWWFFFKVCISWAIVFFSACFISAAIFSMFAFTPSLVE